MGEWGPATAPGLLAGCILEAAAHPGEGGGTDHALHGRARRPGRSPRIARLPRSTSTQGAPPALTAAVAAPLPCRPPREFVRRRPRLPPRPATDAPRPQRSGRGLGPGEERGARQTGAVHYGHPSPSSRRGGTTLAPSEKVVSRETPTSDTPSDSACPFTPHPTGRYSLTTKPAGGSLPPAGFVVVSSAVRWPQQRPPGRQPFRAVGAPRPAISAAASRYATAPAEAGS